MGDKQKRGVRIRGSRHNSSQFQGADAIVVVASKQKEETGVC